MKKWLSWFLFLAILIGAAFLRLLNLGFEDYWYDEMVSLYYAISEGWQSIFWDNSPFLYNFLLKMWVKWWGDTEAMTRLLSVFFSLGTLSLFWFFAAPDQPLWKRVRITLLYVVSFMSLKHARESRPYAMFEFFAALNLMVFLPQLSVQNQIRQQKSILISGWPLLFSHYFSVFQLFVESCWKLYKEKNRKFFFDTLAVVIVLVGIFIFNVRWNSLIWLQSRYELEDLSWSPHAVFFQICFRSIPLAVLIGLLFFQDIRRWKQLSDKNKFLILNILFPLVAMSIFSVVFQASAMIPRYFIFLIPSIIFYLDGKLDSITSFKKSVMAWALMLGLAAINLPKIFNTNKPPWSTAVSMISATPHPKVFTSQSAGVGSPYFQRQGIHVSKWYANPEGVTAIEEAVQSGDTTWMIDSYWAASAYFPSLEALMKEKNYLTEIQSLTNYGTEPIMLMRIRLNKDLQK